jgi:hypothetical protein
LNLDVNLRTVVIELEPVEHSSHVVATGMPPQTAVMEVKFRMVRTTAGPKSQLPFMKQCVRPRALASFCDKSKKIMEKEFVFDLRFSSRANAR